MLAVLAILLEILLTDSARERSISSVLAHMIFHVALLAENPLTTHTFKLVPHLTSKSVQNINDLVSSRLLLL